MATQQIKITQTKELVTVVPLTQTLGQALPADAIVVHSYVPRGKKRAIVKAYAWEKAQAEQDKRPALRSISGSGKPLTVGVYMRSWKDDLFVAVDNNGMPVVADGNQAIARG